MRIILNGQQAFGKAALEKILEAGKDEIVGVFTAPDKDGRPPGPGQAGRARTTTCRSSSRRATRTRRRSRPCAGSMPISWSWPTSSSSFPRPPATFPKQGSICFHPSLLPLHRGPSSINWPIMWGAAKTGFSWFYPTDGLDEGDILIQREVDIGPDDTLGDVYFKKIFPAGVDSVLDVVDAFRAGNPPRSAQDDSQATYESWCRKKDVQLDWERQAGDVYNMIRAGNPQPGAWTTLAGAEVQIYDSRRVDGEGTPGEVVAVSDDGVTVQAGGGRILVKRVRPKGRRQGRGRRMGRGGRRRCRNKTRRIAQ